jgi:nucleoid-associated protein YgaU
VRPTLEAEPTETPPATPTRPAVAQTQTASVVPPASRPTQNAQTPPPPAATAGGRRHLVKPGEGLYTIARKYYGSATNAQVEAIFNANRDRMNSKSDLKAGMELRIP